MVELPAWTPAHIGQYVSAMTSLFEFALDTEGRRPPQWRIWAETRQPCVLVDMLLEPGIFSEEEGSFKVYPRILLTTHFSSNASITFITTGRSLWV